MSEIVQAQMNIRRRKLGLLIRDARLAHRKTMAECAEAIGVTPGVMRAYEEGRRSPSLPELEVLAYYLDLTIQHFWSKDVLSDAPPRTEELNLPVLVGLRQRIVGALLRQRRLDTSMSIKALSEETGIPAGRLKSYELGEQPIPVPELEACMSVLGGRIEMLFDQAGPIGRWMAQQRAIQDFLKLPEDLQAFVSLPVNRPYLELARNLSTMSTEKLRSVAEGLLDITL